MYSYTKCSVSFVLWTYSYLSTDVYIEIVIMAKQQYILFSISILCIVELHISVNTINILRYLCKVFDIVIRF